MANRTKPKSAKARRVTFSMYVPELNALRAIAATRGTSSSAQVRRAVAMLARAEARRADQRSTRSGVIVLDFTHEHDDLPEPIPGTSRESYQRALRQHRSAVGVAVFRQHFDQRRHELIAAGACSPRRSAESSGKPAGRRARRPTAKSPPTDDTDHHRPNFDPGAAGRRQDVGAENSVQQQDRIDGDQSWMAPFASKRGGADGSRRRAGGGKP